MRIIDAGGPDHAWRRTDDEARDDGGVDHEAQVPKEAEQAVHAVDLGLVLPETDGQGAAGHDDGGRAVVVGGHALAQDWRPGDPASESAMVGTAVCRVPAQAGGRGGRERRAAARTHGTAQ